jgi:hypothetical protein
MNHPDDLHSDDLQSVVDELRAHRPEATALELDAVKQRVRTRMSAGRRARSASLMKSRLAILSTLVAGMLLSTTGAGLAVTSLHSARDSAAVAQYATPTPTPTGTPGSKPPGSVLGESNGNQPSGTAGENAGGSPSGTAGENTALQPTRQAENGAGGSLPFTGFLAIPVLLGGVALLTGGLVLRRRAADDRA